MPVLSTSRWMTILRTLGGMAVLMCCRLNRSDLALSQQADPDHVKTLLDQLHGKKRVTAEMVLRKFGPKQQAAVPYLIQALKDKDASICGVAAITLGQIGPGNKQVMSALIKALHDPRHELRSAAVFAIGLIGPLAKAAVPDLILALQDQEIASSATYSLAKIGAPAVPSLIGALQNPDHEVRLHAIEALGECGRSARAAVPDLVRAMHDPDQSVHNAASDALLQIPAP